MNDEAEPPEHVRRNRVHWDARAAFRPDGDDLQLTRRFSFQPRLMPSVMPLMRSCRTGG